jgi:hypothetical protein
LALAIGGRLNRALKSHHITPESAFFEAQALTGNVERLFTGGCFGGGQCAPQGGLRSLLVKFRPQKSRQQVPRRPLATNRQISEQGDRLTGVGRHHLPTPLYPWCPHEKQAQLVHEAYFNKNVQKND